MKLNRIKRIAKICIVSLALLFLVIQTVLFIKLNKTRAKIRTAEKVEFRVYFINSPQDYRTLVVLNDKKEINQFADSLAIGGVWLPLDVLIANTFEIKVYEEGVCEDIIIRGDNIRSGIWEAPIAKKTSVCIESILDKHGVNSEDAYKELIDIMLRKTRTRNPKDMAKSKVD